MEILFIIILVVSWLLIGFCSFVYWWTKDHDFTTNDLWFAFFVSLFGPISFVVGWTIHGKLFTPHKIIIKRRVERITQNE